MKQFHPNCRKKHLETDTFWSFRQSFIKMLLKKIEKINNMVWFAPNFKSFKYEFRILIFLLKILIKFFIFIQYMNLSWTILSSVNWKVDNSYSEYKFKNFFFLYRLIIKQYVQNYIKPVKISYCFSFLKHIYFLLPKKNK